jgi:uncharacterized membrane protein
MGPALARERRVKKNVPVFDSLAFGFREFYRHLPALLPLSALFFAPEFSRLAGWGWPGWASELFKTAVFFALIGRALALTRPAVEKIQGVAAKGRSFAGAEALKWAGMALAVAAGAAMLLLLMAWRSPQWLAAQLVREGWLRLPQIMLDWWFGQGWILRALSVALAAWLPLRAHVAFNFFGFLIIDEGLGPFEAIRASMALTKGAFWGLSFLYLICLALVLLGLAAHVVGAVFTFPVTLLATIYAYRDLHSAQFRRMKI